MRWSPAKCVDLSSLLPGRPPPPPALGFIYDARTRARAREMPRHSWRICALITACLSYPRRRCHCHRRRRRRAVRARDFCRGENNHRRRRLARVHVVRLMLPGDADDDDVRSAHVDRRRRHRANFNQNVCSCTYASCTRINRIIKFSPRCSRTPTEFSLALARERPFSPHSLGV